MPCRAVDGAPFVDWQLPEAMLRIKDHYMKGKGGDREFVDLLLLALEHGIEMVAAACELAVEHNTLRLPIARQGMFTCPRGGHHQSVSHRMLRIRPSTGGSINWWNRSSSHWRRAMIIPG
jgi:hypothetical protein